MGDDASFNEGSSQSLLHIIEPSDFARQKTGGAINDYDIEVVVHRQGIPFTSTQKNHGLLIINQKNI